MQEELFSTDLKRLTEILAVNLYEDPFVPVRELLQNASDACLIRQGFSAFEGSRVTITQNHRERYIEIVDNGCGITEAELKTVLTRIASSNKVEKRRKLLELGFQGAKGIAGKFGLGMLSCFIIAKRVEILTRSMERNSPPLSWYSTGDGKYYWEIGRSPIEVGTRVRLYLKDEDYLSVLLERQRLRKVIDQYCRFLGVPIYFSDSALPVNSSIAPWQNNCPDDEIKTFVQSHFSCAPLYHFHIDHLDDVQISKGRFQGTTAEKVSLQAMVFIPDTRWWSERGGAEVYASGIYVGRLKDILPSWFAFGSAVLESQSLDLTLGRDSIVQDKWRDAVKQIMEERITNHIFANLKDRSSLLRSRFNGIFKVHEEEIKQQARNDYAHGDGYFFGAVKDVIPFDFRGNLVSIPEFVQITPSPGQIDGKRVVYYYSTGFGERGSGLQERLLFDSAEIPYFNAQNYYDRDFLETYNQASAIYRLVPIQKGLEYVLKFEDIDEFTKRLVEDAYDQLGIKAKACRFNPIDIPAVITAVSRGRQEHDYDLSTPEGREKMLEAFVRKDLLLTSETGYTLCVNVANTLIQDLIERIGKDGPQPAFRMALRLVYNNAVILFGEHSNREMATVVSTSSQLMQSYLLSLAQSDAERSRYGKLLGDKETELSNIEIQLHDLRQSINTMRQRQKQAQLDQASRVFLSFSYRPEDEVLAQGMAKLLEEKSFMVIKGKSDNLGSIKETIVRQVKECRYFLAIMTKRHQVDQSTFATSSWFLEEKGIAVGAGRVIVMMVEEGISEEFFGKLQGDIQRFHFGRSTTFLDKCLEAAQLMTKDRTDFLAKLEGFSSEPLNDFDGGSL